MSIQTPVIFVIGVIMVLITIWTAVNAVQADNWRKDTIRFKDGLIYGREAAPISIDSIVTMAKIATLLETVLSVYILIVGIYAGLISLVGWVLFIVTCLIFTVIAASWILSWYEVTKKDIPEHLQRNTR